MGLCPSKVSSVEVPPQTLSEEKKERKKDSYVDGPTKVSSQLQISSEAHGNGKDQYVDEPTGVSQATAKTSFSGNGKSPDRNQPTEVSSPSKTYSAPAPDGSGNDSDVGRPVSTKDDVSDKVKEYLCSSYIV